MLVQRNVYTAEEFDLFVVLPENAVRNFELIAGEIVEKMVSSPRSSEIGALFVTVLTMFVRQHKLGRVTGADGGYRVNGERYIPAAASVSFARQPERTDEAYNPLAPDLAVEVLSPTNQDEEMRLKIGNYLAAGTMVWVEDPDRARVEVYRSGQVPLVLGLNDTLDGGEVLPGFTLPVREVFEV